MRHLGKWLMALGLLAIAPAASDAALWGNSAQNQQAAKQKNQKAANEVAGALRNAKLQGYDIGIEVKEGVPRGKVIAFSAPPTLAAAAAPAAALETAPAAAPSDAAARGRGGRGGGPRACWVYIPAGYKEGDVLPFMVDHDGRADAVVQVQLIAAMDILIAEKKIPMMAAVFIAPVSRSVEYDTVSGVYADYLEKIVLLLAEKTGNLKLSNNPDARGAIGQSSGSAAAFGMAWFHTPAFNRVISYSGSWTQLQKSATAPKGAQEYQDSLIPNTEKKPIRIWMQVGSNDLNNQFGDWRVQNNAFAIALKKSSEGV